MDNELQVQRVKCTQLVIKWTYHNTLQTFGSSSDFIFPLYVSRILFFKCSVSCFLRHEYVKKISQKFVSPLIRFTLIWHSVFEVYILSNSPCSIYIKILTWLRGLRFKIANFSPLHCLAIPRRDLSTKKTKPNREKWPESLGVVLEFLIYRK